MNDRKALGITNLGIERKLGIELILYAKKERYDNNTEMQVYWGNILCSIICEYIAVLDKL
jgi:hypothetical protein